MDIEIEIVLPEQTMDQLAHGLCNLTEAISKIDEGLVAHGILGGEFGYGAHYENEVFVMRPYYWGDCDCDSEERANRFWSENEHSPDCYRTEMDEEMRRAGVHWECAVVMEYAEKEHIRQEIYSRLCAKYGLPDYGCAVHCTCGLKERAEKSDMGHTPECAVELPNFQHKQTGLEVRWYKYIGRDMDVSAEADYDAIIRECLISLPTPPDKET